MKMPFSLRRMFNCPPNAGIAAIALTCEIVVVLTAFTSNLFGDDTPQTRCVSVSSLVESVPPYDLSSLSQIQQSNVSYYLKELARNNLEIPRRLKVLKGPFFRDQSHKDAQLRFTLIFSDGDCESQCVGNAVLPDSTGFKLRKFSYRNNLVIRPGQYPFSAHGHETALGSLVLLDKKGRSFVAFRDVFDMTTANPRPDRELKYSRSEYLRFTPENVWTDLRKNYLACLLNVFPVNAPMPGSGAG
jgi:hypothetical protein